MGREGDAVEDRVGARRLAVDLGDRHLLADVLLEEAAALDGVREFELSAERADEARSLVEELGSEPLRVRLLVADGRTAARRGRSIAAIELLEEARVRAAALNDHGSRVIARLVLGWLHGVAGQLEKAEARLDEVMTLTEATGDRTHLCVAYQCRNPLWIARKRPDKAMEDLQISAALARECGNASTERLASDNAAEMLHWSGQSEEALALARRARLLEGRLLDQPYAFGSLLLARILVEREAHDEARRLCVWVAQSHLSDLSKASEIAECLSCIFRMLCLILREVSPGPAEIPDVPGGGDETVAAAEREVREDRMAVEYLLEILYWRARMAFRGSRRDEALQALGRARPWLEQSALMKPRFEDLERTETIETLSVTLSRSLESAGGC